MRPEDLGYCPDVTIFEEYEEITPSPILGLDGRPVAYYTNSTRQGWIGFLTYHDKEEE